jgi:hypothetical protein
MKKNNFKPRAFADFADWILSEIGHVTIDDLNKFYKKITSKEIVIETKKTETK